MQLADYLAQQGLTQRALAAIVGVSEPTMHRIVTRRRIPSRDVMQRIVAATNGQVQPNDFYETA